MAKKKVLESPIRSKLNEQGIIDASVFELSFVPPHDKQHEDFVISVLINGLFSEYLNEMDEDLFYQQDCALIFRVMKILYNDAEAIDILSISHKARSLGLDDKIRGIESNCTVVISKKANCGFVFNSMRFEGNLRVLREFSLRRKLMHISHNSFGLSVNMETDIFETYDTATSMIGDTILKMVKKDVASISDAMPEFVRNFTERFGAGVTHTGVRSGIYGVDNILGVFGNTDMITIAGRPGMGKTAFGMSLVHNLAVVQDIPVAVFSLEMNTQQLISRIVSIESKVSLEVVGRKQPDEAAYNRVNSCIDKVMQSPIYIDDTPALDIYEFRAKVKRLVAKHGVKLVMLDYLQLCSISSGDGKNREQEVSNMSRIVKQTAKENNVPVIAFSQLSRAVEQRGGEKRPVLSDLRESGSIEQDSDVVIFLYRPEYYGLETDADGNSTRDKGVAIVAKHRHGACGDVVLDFRKELAYYYDTRGGYNAHPEYHPDRFHSSHAIIQDDPF